MSAARSVRPSSGSTQAVACARSADFGRQNLFAIIVLDLKELPGSPPENGNNVTRSPQEKKEFFLVSTIQEGRNRELPTTRKSQTRRALRSCAERHRTRREMSDPVTIAPAPRL